MSGWGDIRPGGSDGCGDEPWARTADRNVWRAYKSGLVLTVTHVVGGGWQAVIEGPDVTRHSPVRDPDALPRRGPTTAQAVRGERPH